MKRKKSAKAIKAAEESRKKIKRRLYELSEYTGFNQADAATVCDISSQYMSKIYNGKVDAKGSSLKLIAEETFGIQDYEFMQEGYFPQAYKDEKEEIMNQVNQLLMPEKELLIPINHLLMSETYLLASIKVFLNSINHLLNTINQCLKSVNELLKLINEPLNSENHLRASKNELLNEKSKFLI